MTVPHAPCGRNPVVFGRVRALHTAPHMPFVRAMSPAVRPTVALLSMLALALGGCAADSSDPRRDDEPPAPTTDAGPSPTEDAGTTPPPSGTDSGTSTPPPPRPGDRDADGLPDEDESARGTDPDDDDTDGDGVKDGVEVLAGTDPTDPGSTIPDEDFYVVLPYEDPAEVRELDFTARLGKGDVFFLVDTTGSMGPAIGNVRSSLASTIVPAVGDAIADVQMGVGDYRDFPVDPYGSPGDWPFELRQALTADTSAVQTALNGLSAGGGNDGPEAMLEGLYDSVAGGSCAGGFGEACFRDDSHPIIVVVTDAPAHNNPSGDADYDGSVTARSWSETMSALGAEDVKIVGAAVSSFFGGLVPPASRDNLETLARDTGSRASGGSLTVYDAEGGSVSESIVDGIVDLVGAETQDVTSRQIDDPSDEVDATRFIQSVAPLRATRATDFDETTFYGVAGGTTITFEVTFRNDFLPEETYVQIFQAEIEVHDLPGMTRLDIRNVYIVVPAVGGTLI